MLARMISQAESPGTHHDYVGLVGLDPSVAHALTSTLTTVCRSQRPSEFIRRDRLGGWYPLCSRCHPTRLQDADSPAPPPAVASAARRRRWGPLGALVLTWGLFAAHALITVVR